MNAADSEVNSVEYELDPTGARRQLHLTLENFDSEDIPEDCPYVLTSPKSLEACKRLCVKPIELLPCSIDEIRDHLACEGDLSFDSLLILREAEEERRKTLEHCRRLRQELIEEDEDLFRCQQFQNHSRGKFDELGSIREDESDDGVGAHQRSKSFNAPGSRAGLNSRSSPPPLSDPSPSLSPSPYSLGDQPEADQFPEESGSSSMSQGPTTSSTSRSPSSSLLCTTEDSSAKLTHNWADFSYATKVRSALERSLSPGGEIPLNVQKTARSSFGNTKRAEDTHKEDATLAKLSSQTPLGKLVPHHTINQYPGLLKLKATRRKSPAPKTRKSPEPTRLSVSNSLIQIPNPSNNYSQFVPKDSRHHKHAVIAVASTPKLPPGKAAKTDRFHRKLPRSRTDMSERSKSMCSHENRQPNILDTTSSAVFGGPMFRSISPPSPPCTAPLDNNNTINVEKLDLEVRMKLKALRSEDIPKVDGKILMILAKKQEMHRLAAESARAKNLMWQSEQAKFLEDRRKREIEHKKSIEEKRTQEATLNDQRLREARQRLSESQELLRRLIEQKDHKSKAILEGKTGLNPELPAKWRTVEESKRMAVDKALDELLTRDSQYRNELASQLGDKLQRAHHRRSSRKDQLIERMHQSQAMEQERHHQKMLLIQRQRREELKRYREMIQAKMGRICSWQESNQNMKKHQPFRHDRESKSAKVRQLKSELEAKMSDWRRQVLTVQSETLRAAEAKAQNQLTIRKSRVVSQNRLRERRHSQKRQQVQDEERVVEVEGRRQIMDKQARVERLLEERERETRKSRERAMKLAEIRDQIKEKMNPNSFDQMVTRVQLELRTTQGASAVNNRFV